jgi:hypothetical protein
VTSKYYTIIIIIIVVVVVVVVIIIMNIRQPDYLRPRSGQNALREKLDFGCFLPGLWRVVLTA